MPLSLLNNEPPAWNPSVDHTLIGTSGSGVWVKDEVGNVYYLVSGSPDNQYSTATNNSGNTTLSRTASTHVAVVNFGGSARTSIIILDVSACTAGDIIKIRGNLPATSLIVIEIRNATSGGTLLFSYTTDGSSDDAYWELYFDGSAWQRLFNVLPAY